jgi:hypothetical protein
MVLAIESPMLMSGTSDIEVRAMSASIDYGNLMHNAMRGLIQTVLERVAQKGLPGDHHFFISFDTTHPGVAIADRLRERYPEEMTIVIQHWFEDLIVTDKGFSITLNFGDTPEPLVVPFDALKTFVDPSVEFGLRFETQVSLEETEDEDDAAPESQTPAKGKGDAQIVSLDQFRK